LVWFNLPNKHIIRNKLNQCYFAKVVLIYLIWYKVKMFNRIVKILKSSVIFLLVFPAYITAHIAVYFSVAHFFPFSAPLGRNLAIWIIFLLGTFLGFSIMISALLAHRWDNHFNRKYYFFSGIWVGFMINLLLFFALGWLVLLFGSLFGFKYSRQIVGIFSIVGATLYSLYGIINAFTPIVKKIEIPIKNLPKFWNGKKIVQISDVHLGHIYREEFMCQVAEKINSLKPEVILITGDLFDGTDGKLDVFAQSLDLLEAPKGIFYASGNHETYLTNTQEVFEVLKKTKIVALRNEMRVLEGLQFIGIEYPHPMEKRRVAETIKQLPAFNSTQPSVLLWHIPAQIRKIRKLGISLMLCGHTHKGQLFPFGIATKFMFRGYDYGLKIKGGLAVYTSCGLGAWGTPMRTEGHSEIVEITLTKES